MSQYQQRQHPGHTDCPPPSDPAPQPHPPTSGEECPDFPTTTPPTLDPPPRCPDPEPPCHCPTPPPGTGPNCLEDLIAVRTAQIAAAADAEASKKELSAFLVAANKATSEYTRDNYDRLVKQWVKLDAEIAELIRKLVCAVPCWRCIIECHVCPPINELHYAEKWLYGTGALYPDVHNLHDLRYWHTRDKEAKERTVKRIQDVLKAWANPYQTINKILFTDNPKVIADAGKLLGSAEASKAVYDVLLKLVPMHLAVAPPSGSAWTTKIGKEYTDFCRCEPPTPDDCCGPDVGPWSVLQRLVGPQPYLIDPNDYFKLICCLVEHRYGPANDALTKAKASLLGVEEQIKRYQTQLDKLKDPQSFHTEARAAVPSNVDCCDYEPEDKPSQAR